MVRTTKTVYIEVKKGTVDSGRNYDSIDRSGEDANDSDNAKGEHQILTELSAPGMRQ